MKYVFDEQPIDDEESGYCRDRLGRFVAGTRGGGRPRSAVPRTVKKILTLFQKGEIDVKTAALRIEMSGYQLPKTIQILLAGTQGADG